MFNYAQLLQNKRSRIDLNCTLDISANMFFSYLLLAHFHKARGWDKLHTLFF